ncbi:TetR/AcrR family transcriptional regulator [Paremcibacter congregatus]|uniref:TetR/AcrR family transcriptional regulator n=1 Tax=Paremcibacter congregatus TaxID=2043170 RepID=UPI0030ED932C|tara:strand:- start:233 stop:931 length:699 start_codon:yes stop_codon:yes gene_type:complete
MRLILTAQQRKAIPELTNGPKPRKELILDAAEDLFSKWGYDGVSLRQIATLAHVDVALLNYHFGKKRNLFEEVFKRRAQIIHDIREEALTDCLTQAEPGLPTVEQLIASLLLPLADIAESDDPGWQNYCALVAYVNNSREWGKIMMPKYFDPLVQRLVKVLQAIIPDAPEEKIYWSHELMSGAVMLVLSRTGRIDILSQGLCKSSEVRTAIELMIPFCAAGIQEICKKKPEE